MCEIRLQSSNTCAEGIELSADHALPKRSTWEGMSYDKEAERDVHLVGLGVGEVGVVHKVAAESAKAPVVARVLEDVHDGHGAVAVLV